MRIVATFFLCLILLTTVESQGIPGLQLQNILEVCRNIYNTYQYLKDNNMIPEPNLKSYLFRSTPAAPSTYDAVIDIYSVFGCLDKGYGVYLNGNPNYFSQLPQHKGVVISVQGMYNKGKTFLMFLLTGTSLPAGYVTHTTGVSLKLIDDKLLLVDTAGSRTPAPDDKTAIFERKMTDAWIQYLGYRLSDVTLFVVNQLTLDDQIQIASARAQILHNCPSCTTADTKAKMIIVHNLKDIDSIEDAEKVIAKDIVQFFKAKKVVGLKGKEYWESENHFHVVFVRETTPPTPASAHFNANSKAQLLDWIHGYKNLHELDIFNQLTKITQETLPKFLINNTAPASCSNGECVRHPFFITKVLSLLGLGTEQKTYLQSEVKLEISVKHLQSPDENQPAAVIVASNDLSGIGFAILEI